MTRERASDVLAGVARIVAELEAAEIPGGPARIGKVDIETADYRLELTPRDDPDRAAFLAALESPADPGAPRTPRPARRRRKITPELLDDITVRRSRGETVPEIAAHYGGSVRNVSRWVAEAAARNGSSS